MIGKPDHRSSCAYGTGVVKGVAPTFGEKPAVQGLSVQGVGCGGVTVHVYFAAVRAASLRQSPAPLRQDSPGLSGLQADLAGAMSGPPAQEP